ncbi:hypothetical protein LARV_02133 [Longilinea arvoryzae]|uniref:Uncharacterized protein n=1 Tax=Longilinea arvoryzae TaxID=360412 RepID=A0A0S7BFJ4_9CHLR|nr:hypothetical protein [Longilinea arvoryzae]GAP14365.1 hypothetical protein LARV_02133 [Longilinea arvoryzae]
MNALFHYYQVVVDSLTAHPSKRYYRLNRIFLGLVFVAGLIFWGLFMNWGRGPITFHDWADITAPRLTLIRNAVSSLTLPLNASTPMDMGATASTKVLAIPDLLLSPQIVFLPFMSVAQFSLFQVVLLYAAGFWGLLQLRRKLNWSLLTFGIVDVLFNFNGNITAGIAVGHLTWTGYFLFPWFAYLIFEAINQKPGWQWIFKMAVVLFAVLLQGSYHQFIWLLFFLGFFAIAYYRNFMTIASAAVFSVLLGFMRLTPEFSLLDDYKNEFIAGYLNVGAIYHALVMVDKPILARLAGVGKYLGTWELSLYIGFAGFAFLVLFGLIRPWFRKPLKNRYIRCYIPVLGMVLLSMNQVYKPLRDTFDIPILSGERVATRIIIVGFVFLVFLAANEFQLWLDYRKRSPFAFGAVFAFSGWGLFEIFNNARQWRVVAASWYFPESEFNASKWTLANQYTESAYLNLVLLGIAFTMFCAIFLIAMALHEKNQRRTRIAETPIHQLLAHG